MQYDRTTTGVPKTVACLKGSDHHETETGGRDRWLPYAAAVALLATEQAQLGWLQHEFGHSSVFGSVRANKLAHCVIIGHLKGASSAWWNFRHFRHHSQPNIVCEDPDIDAPCLCPSSRPYTKP